MTPQQYVYCSRGYFLRSDRKQEGLRKIWALIFNVNAPKGKSMGSDRVMDVWPLSTDNKELQIISREDMRAKFRRALEKSLERKEKQINGNSKA